MHRLRKIFQFVPATGEFLAVFAGKQPGNVSVRPVELWAYCELAISAINPDDPDETAATENGLVPCCLGDDGVLRPVETDDYLGCDTKIEFKPGKWKVASLRWHARKRDLA